MSEALVVGNALPPTPPDIIAKIVAVETKMRKSEDTLQVTTEHVFHAGMYSRTIRVAAMMAFTSVLIKIPTILIVNGKCCVFAGSRWHTLEGYNVIPASAGRKQIYVTLGPTEITMLFPSDAKTVAEAESQFTDEVESLFTRRHEGNDMVTVTGH
jgi:selenocysteine-specific translation elongation factor